MKNIKIILVAVLLMFVASSFAQQNAGSTDKNQAKAIAGQEVQSDRPVNDPPVLTSGNSNEKANAGSPAPVTEALKSESAAEPSAANPSGKTGAKDSGNDVAEPASKSISEYSGPTVASPSHEVKPDLK